SAVFGDARVRLDEVDRDREVQADGVARPPGPANRQVGSRSDLVGGGCAVDFDGGAFAAPGGGADGKGDLAVAVGLDRDVALPGVAGLLAEADGAAVGEEDSGSALAVEVDLNRVVGHRVEVAGDRGDGAGDVGRAAGALEPGLAAVT